MKCAPGFFYFGVGAQLIVSARGTNNPSYAAEQTTDETTLHLFPAAFKMSRICMDLVVAFVLFVFMLVLLCCWVDTGSQ